MTSKMYKVWYEEHPGTGLIKSFATGGRVVNGLKWVERIGVEFLDGKKRLIRAEIDSYVPGATAKVRMDTKGLSDEQSFAMLELSGKFIGQLKGVQ